MSTKKKVEISRNSLKISLRNAKCEGKLIKDIEIFLYEEGQWDLANTLDLLDNIIESKSYKNISLNIMNQESDHSLKAPFADF